MIKRVVLHSGRDSIDRSQGPARWRKARTAEDTRMNSYLAPTFWQQDTPRAGIRLRKHISPNSKVVLWGILSFGTSICKCQGSG